MFDKPISQIMKKYPLTVTKNTKISKVSELLLNYQINGLIVLDDDNEALYGIVTTTDLLNLLVKTSKGSGDLAEKFKEVSQQIVDTIATKSVLKLKTDSTIKDAIDIIDKHGAHTIPIYNELDKLIGVVGRHDFLNFAFKN